MKSNIEKIKKEIDKSDPEDLSPLFIQIKNYIDAKLIEKSKEYGELAEKFLSLSNHINNIK